MYSNSRDYNAAKARRNGFIGLDVNGNHLCEKNEHDLARDAQRAQEVASKAEKAKQIDDARNAAYIAARRSGLSIDDASEIDAVYEFQYDHNECSAHDDEKCGRMTLEQLVAKYNA